MKKLRPLIGIGADITQESNSRNYLVPAHYVEAVEISGGLPLLLPPRIAGHSRYLDMLDGFLLPGGGDFSAEILGQPVPDECTLADNERSRSDLALILNLVERDIPFLGICFGMQTLNVALGGSLHLHLPKLPGFANHQSPGSGPPTFHHLKVAPDSGLASMLELTSCEVNSYHHQGVDRLGQSVQAAAWSEDGLIEAIQGPGAFSYGMQWHPERNMGAAHNRRLFAAFIEAARVFRKKKHDGS